jgi:flagellar capping protein FliD
VGSATTGLGGLSQTFQQFSDPISGLLQTEAKGLATTDQNLQSQITTLTSQMTVMQNNLASQLSSADAAIAELQSQQTELTASLQGLSLVLYGPNTSNSSG